MCGFVGIINCNGAGYNPESFALLQSMGEQISHRGPDETQYFCDGPLGVVFNRLSIVDLQSGSQPFLNEDRSVMLVVNGEIYNHKQLKSQLQGHHVFQSDSDCEVLLHLYEEHGIDALKMVNGMFAAAIWDMRRQRLYIARDRLGIKPLYYSKFNGQLAFASELKALLAHPDCPREFDWFQALSGRNSPLIEQQSLPTYFKDIHYLPAGNYLSIDIGSSQIHQHVWWNYPDLGEEEQLADTRSKEEIIEQYAQTLEAAVSRRLMSDVDVGLFLSGGIDSVAIAAFASKQLPDLQTFSVFSQSTFQNGDAQSSFEAARHFGLSNHQVNFSWHNNSFKASHWKDLVWLLETPEIDAEHLYKYHLHRYARHHFPNLKVMLLGQGSDELNGGYSHVYLEKFRPDLQESNYGWPALMETMREIERHYLTSGQNSEISHYGNLVHRQFMAISSNSQLSTHPWQTYTRMNRQNLQMYNLWHEDRTSSGNSIESRVPFLDHELVELCAKVPEKHYQDLFWDKRILREAMKPWLPERFCERPKVPFFMGQDQRFTQRMMYNLLIDDDYALLNEAFGDSRHSVISTQELNKLIDSIPKDPEYQGVESLLKITSMGLLEKMAKELPIPHKHVSNSYSVLDSLNISDWSEQEQSSLQESMSTRRSELCLGRPIALADNVQLLTNSSKMYQSTCIFIAVNGRIEYELSEEGDGDWMKVIQHIDGTHSLEQICTDLEIPVSKVRKHIEEAIDYDLLTF